MRLERAADLVADSACEHIFIILYPIKEDIASAKTSPSPIFRLSDCIGDEIALVVPAQQKGSDHFSQYQDDPNMFKSGMDWLNNILKNGFGWHLTASIACCGEPEEESAAYKTLMRQAYEAGTALGED